MRDDTESDEHLYRDIIESEETAKQLVTVGGKRQAPCLFIDGKPLYESQDIIDWREGASTGNIELQKRKSSHLGQPSHVDK